jgi:hypothetical protein
MAAGVALGALIRGVHQGTSKKLAHRTDGVRRLNRDERSAFPSRFGVALSR